MGPWAHGLILRMRYGGMGPWAGWASPWGGLPGMGYPRSRPTWIQPWAIPYNARARNVRACPRARARGMNPRWR